MNRFKLGVWLIAGSTILGWLSLAEAGIFAFTHPWISKAGMAVYAFSWLVFGAGVLLAGKKGLSVSWELIKRLGRKKGK